MCNALQLVAEIFRNGDSYRPLQGRARIQRTVAPAVLSPAHACCRSPTSLSEPMGSCSFNSQSSKTQAREGQCKLAVQPTLHGSLFTVQALDAEVLGLRRLLPKSWWVLSRASSGPALHPAIQVKCKFSVLQNKARVAA